MTTPYIVTQTYTTFFHDGKVHTITDDHPNFPAVVIAVYEGQIDEAVRLADLPSRIQHYASGHLEIVNDTVRYKDQRVENVLTTRIIEMMQRKLPIQPMINFLDNLLQNPSRRAVQELYTFLEKCRLPITPDGCFLAYKRVKFNWTDCYSGTISNHIGARPSMPRNDVDDDTDVPCSTGFHCCSFDYLKSFWGERLIAVKVNPRDVVSIPKDYNHTKVRCCTYEVVQELEMPEEWTNFWEDTPVVGVEPENDDPDWEQEELDEEQREDLEIQIQDTEDDLDTVNREIKEATTAFYNGTETKGFVVEMIQRREDLEAELGRLRSDLANL